MDMVRKHQSAQSGISADITSGLCFCQSSPSRLVNALSLSLLSLASTKV
jgi:hypothetical protein